MWKILCGSFPGASHRAIGAGCQDYCCTRSLVLSDDEVLILACADGAGSAEHSSLGARLACEHIADLIDSELRQRGRFEQVTQENARLWFRAVRERLAVASEVSDFELKSLACTLLVSILGNGGSAFLQVGDGAIVAPSDGQYQHVFWPQNGEYANTTNFVTSLSAIEALDFQWRDSRIDEIAMFTDGLQMLALDYRARRAHQPFFAPLFGQLRGSPSAEELQAPFSDFLTSPRLDERTDDDKTLMLAARTGMDGTAR